MRLLANFHRHSECIAIPPPSPLPLTICESPDDANGVEGDCGSSRSDSHLGRRMRSSRMVFDGQSSGERRIASLLRRGREAAGRPCYVTVLVVKGRETAASACGASPRAASRRGRADRRQWATNRVFSANCGISLTGLGPEGGSWLYRCAFQRFAKRTVAGRDGHASDAPGRVASETEAVDELVAKIAVRLAN